MATDSNGPPGPQEIKQGETPSTPSYPGLLLTLHLIVEVNEDPVNAIAALETVCRTFEDIAREAQDLTRKLEDLSELPAPRPTSFHILTRAERVVPLYPPQGLLVRRLDESIQFSRHGVFFSLKCREVLLTCQSLHIYPHDDHSDSEVSTEFIEKVARFIEKVARLQETSVAFRDEWRLHVRIAEQIIAEFQPRQSGMD
jgi:hypothetical protein